MSKSLVRSALTSFVLCGVGVLVPVPAETQRDTSSADARLRALYTEEWNWRRQEMARSSDQPGEAGASDHFPRVNAASQQARLAYWTRTLATLGSIPLDELSPVEKVNAQVFRHFHDAILSLGSVPLPVLEQRMAQFIADGGVNQPAAPAP
jgi:uncharacterized protein (DUF885 family)